MKKKKPKDKVRARVRGRPPLCCDEDTFKRLWAQAEKEGDTETLAVLEKVRARGPWPVTLTEEEVDRLIEPARRLVGPSCYYGVGLDGDLALALDGRLTDMVRTRCARCKTPLLAQGPGYRETLAKAKALGQRLRPICGPCLMAIGGPATREECRPYDIPPNYYHEEELASLLNRAT